MPDWINERDASEAMGVKNDREQQGRDLCQEVRETTPSYTSDRIYTYEDYLKLPDEELYHYEILDGMLIREPAPTTLHQRVSRRIQRLLEDYFWETDPGAEVFNAPIDLTLSDTNVVQPDLVYVPSNSHIVEEKRINGIPQLVVEVISPSTKSKDRIEKADIYRRLGVPHYWIVDPVEQTIEALRLTCVGDYDIISSAEGSGVFTHPDYPGLAIGLESLWGKRPL
ncbi:MAG: Uma2 family endonuclease [Firmicutes bacterium]|nr:Uma2 family endonuclease [Bacillota bacterium]